MKKTKLTKDSVVIGKDHRAYKDTADFLFFLAQYPKQRFFQALRNWIGCQYLQADDEDTFYWENIRQSEKG